LGSHFASNNGRKSRLFPKKLWVLPKKRNFWEDGRVNNLSKEKYARVGLFGRGRSWSTSRKISREDSRAVNRAQSTEGEGKDKLRAVLEEEGVGFYIMYNGARKRKSRSIPKQGRREKVNLRYEGGKKEVIVE